MSFATHLTKRVWNGRDNTVGLIVRDGGVKKDLSAVTRMTLELNDSTVVDTATAAAGTITWDASGNVTMRLGALGIPDGTYTCELVAFDPSNPDGVMLVHPNATAQLTLLFETD